MKILFISVLVVFLHQPSHALINHEQLASLCKHGAPEGLVSTWITTTSTQILDSIQKVSTTPVVLKECTRNNEANKNLILNSGERCTFQYQFEDMKWDIHFIFPELIKTSIVDTKYGPVMVFEKGYQPFYSIHTSHGESAAFFVTAACRRADVDNGFYALQDDEGLIELNP